MLLHTFRGLSQLGHAFAKFANDAAPLLLTHLVKTVERLANFRQHCPLISPVPGSLLESSAPGIRRMALRSGTAARKTRPQPPGMPRCSRPRAGGSKKTLHCWTLKAQRDFMWPRAILSFRSRRSCISRESVPEGRRKCKSRKRWFTDFSENANARRPLEAAAPAELLLPLHFTPHLGKASHRPYRQSGMHVHVSATTLDKSELANCNSYNRRYVPSLLINSSCVPMSAMVPFSITTIRSARRTVDKRCAITSTVRPLIRLCRADCTKASDSLSSADVASSRISTGAFFRSARAIASR